MFIIQLFCAGCVGGICGLANILGQECCDLEELFRQGKMEEAKVLQHRLIGPNIGVGLQGVATYIRWIFLLMKTFVARIHFSVQVFGFVDTC